jgi:hypothetical protein
MYSATNNRIVMSMWDTYPDDVRAVWFERVRAVLHSLSVPWDIMSECGEHEALGLAVILDGCPPHTLPRSVHGWFLQFRVWCHLVEGDKNPFVLRVLEV